MITLEELECTHLSVGQGDLITSGQGPGKEKPAVTRAEGGAGTKSRTRDLLITSQFESAPGGGRGNRVH